MKYTYKYVNPLENNMKKSNINLSKLYKLGLKKRGNIFFNKVDVFFNDQRILIEFRITFLAKVLLILLFPVQVFIAGIYEAFDDTKRLLSQTKYGSFSTQTIFIQNVNKKHGDFSKNIIKEIIK